MRDYTVFVVGAGASVGYGLPTARQLRDHIINEQQYSEIAPALAAVEKKNLDVEYYDALAKRFTQFKQQLAYSKRESIDQFLSDRVEYGVIGKVCIAQALLPIESKASVSTSCADDWLAWLLGGVHFDLRAAETDYSFRIITFNYDRLVELAIARMAVARHGFSHEDARRVVAAFPLLHVYGALGGAPSAADLERGFENVPTPPSAVAAAAETLRIAGEDRGVRRVQVRSPSEWIQGASRIVFLGFGYGKQNLGVLGLRPNKEGLLNPRVSILGSAVGLTSQEVNQVRAGFQSVAWEMDSRAGGCLEFLREHLHSSMFSNIIDIEDVM